MNLVVTDEINIHVPQTIEAYAEAEQLLGIQRNLMSAQTNKPMMGIVYDSLSGAYLLTFPQEEYERLDKMEVKDVERLNEMKRRSIIDKIVFDLAIKNVINTPQYQTLFKRLEYYKVHPQSGRALISASFPEDFDYNSKGVTIKNGILVKGVLGKDTLGNKDGSIISEMCKQLGGSITVDFMSNIQFIVKDFLAQHGLSVGIDDCIPTNSEFRREIDEMVLNAVNKVISMSDNKIKPEQQERKICAILDSAKNDGDGIINKYLDKDNSIMIMSNSGAKGTKFNYIQMSSLLGSQKVSGKRIPANLPGGRSLPSVEPGSKDPRDRGFVTGSFGSGLNPREFFFHAQGGREGLTDTAVNTAQTGFLQHQIIKSAEDIHISPDGSVRSADLGIVQFVFGNDGLDSAELSTVKIHGEPVPFFRNLQLLSDKINRKYAQ